LVGDLNAKIDAQTDAVIQGLPDRVAAAQAKLDFLRKGQSEWLAEGETSPARGPATTDDVHKEIRDIQAMIQNSPDLINAAGSGFNHDKTPLQLAAEKGQLIVAKYLLDHGANVNGRSGETKNTPLFA